MTETVAFDKQSSVRQGQCKPAVCPKVNITPESQTES